MSTTTTKHVSANVWACYDAVVNHNDKPSDVAKRLGITPSSVSANVKRVRDSIDAGHTVVVDDGTTVTTGEPTAPVVDRGAIADSMVPGASAIVDRIDKLDAEAAKLRERASKLRDDAAKLDADADAVSASVDNVWTFAHAAGFERDAFERALADASKPAEPTDKPAA